jgi:hypothetical protein
VLDVNSLVEIEDPGIKEYGESLIERLFPDGFYVLADDGRYLTTPNNADLLEQALALIQEAGDPEAPEIVEDLEEIVSQADALSQEGYDAAWAREAERNSDEDFDDWEREEEEKESWGEEE